MSDSSPVPKKPIHKKWWFWAVIAIVGFMIISSASKSPSGKTTGNESDSPAKTSELKKEDAVAVSADDLFAAYEKNEIAADTAYKGKILKVTGIVNNVGKDILDAPYVSLKTGSIFGVQCMLSKSAVEQASMLESGKSVTLQGKNSGKLGNIILRDCVFAE